MKNNQLNIESEFIDFKDQLESYLYRLTANRFDTDDLLHDTYIKVRDKIKTFKGNSSFKTWTFAIATNLAKDNQRVKNRWKLDVQDECKYAASSNPKYNDKIVSAFQNQTEKKFEIEEHINYCFTCIAKNLPLEQQISIVLKEFYHFKRKEISKIIDKTEGVVKHYLYNARKALQTKFDQRCAIVNKTGVCYQCAELNDYLQDETNSGIKIKKLDMSREKSAKNNLDIRFKLINKINPLNGNGAKLEDTILQILREVIKDK